MTNSTAAGSTPSVAVVGAGLSGLSAAWRLHRQGWRVRVYEAGAHVGGRVRTLNEQGFLIDAGASALAQSYTHYLQLAEEIGLRSEIVPTSPVTGIVRDGRICHIDTSRMLRSGMMTRALSFGAKLRLSRVAFDVAMAKLRGQLDYADLSRAAPLDDCSARDYLRSRSNEEIDTYIGDPIARTMLITDSDKISRIELYSGLANIMANRFFALRGGVQRFAEVLAAPLDVQLHSRVQRVQERDGGVDVQFQSADEAARTERFDACVVACPLPAAMSICVDQQALLAPLASTLRYTQAITVAVATKRKPETPAFVLQIPGRENAELALMFIEHNKCADRAPAGCGLIGVDWEAEASRRWFDRSDADIAEHTLKGVFALMPELKDQILFTHVTRWPLALPLTEVGIYRKIGALNAALDAQARIQFAADYLSAAGQNTAVAFGERAAARLRHLVP